MATKRPFPFIFKVATGFLTSLLIFAGWNSLQQKRAHQLFSSREKVEPPVIREKEAVVESEKPLILAPPLPVAQKAPSPIKEVVIEKKNHVVKPMETLSSISRLYYGTDTKWEKIWEANKDRVPNKNRIRPGLVLLIPELNPSSPTPKPPKDEPESLGINPSPLNGE